jgi:Fungal Zn(2)-Cys(6) binuclear cluster domain
MATSHGRKRRVKCDETKPECLRCQNFGCDCDGYEFTSHKVSWITPRRLLVPRAQGAVHIQPQKSSNGMWSDQMFGSIRGGQVRQARFAKNGSHQALMDRSLAIVSYGKLNPNITTANSAFSTVIQSPSTTIFESEQEIRYFRFYCDTTAQQLSGVSILRMVFYYGRLI